MSIEEIFEYPAACRLSIFKIKRFHMVTPTKLSLITEIHTCNFRMIFLLLPAQICVPYFFAWYSVTNNIHTEQVIILFSKVFFQSRHLAGSAREKYTSPRIKVCLHIFECISQLTLGQVTRFIVG